MVSKESLLKIRKNVEGYIGQEICVKANIGRNKCINKKGVVDSAYPNIFVIKDEVTSSKLTYNYTDLITNNLEISLPSGETIFTFENNPMPKYTRL